MAKQLRAMDTAALIAMRGKIDAVLAERRKDLETQLAAMGGSDVPFPLKAKVKLGNGLAGRKGRRAKAAPKYRSKKDKSVKWSGRGMTPIWMREEMKGTKLKKDDFLIK